MIMPDTCGASDLSGHSFRRTSGARAINHAPWAGTIRSLGAGRTRSDGSAIHQRAALANRVKGPTRSD